MRLAVLPWIVLAACKGDKVPVGDDDDDMSVDCLGAEPFVAGEEHMTTSGRYVAIAEAAPTPPDVGDNSWVLSVRSDTGPVEGLTPVVTPWMPLHDHGLVPADYSATDLGGGRYQVDTFDLIMPGAWEFTVDLGGEDTAVLLLCAEG